MKDISANESLLVPEGVTVAINARTVTVEGPRGKLVKNVGHIQMDLQLVSLEVRYLCSGFGDVLKSFLWEWDWQPAIVKE